MKYNRVIIYIIFICTSLGLFGCDRSGNLSVEEVHTLSVELENDFQNSQIWELKPIIFHTENDTDNQIAFMIDAIETIFENKGMFSDMYGSWFDKKNTCKALRIVCQIPYNTAQNDFIIDELIIAKYYDRNSYKIWLYYHRADEINKTRCFEVVLQ